MGGGARINQAPGSLIGRNDDLDYITAFVDQAAVSGGALLLSGEAGLGKSVLLDAAAAHAETAGSRVLRAAGTEFEGAVSFAGLNQLLGPLLGRARGLSLAYRRALAVALGVREGSSPDQLLLSNAALALLVQAAGPVLDKGESVNTLLAGFPADAPQPPPAAQGRLPLPGPRKFPASFAGDLPAGQAAFMAIPRSPGA